MALRTQAFQGELPRLGKRLLGDSQAQKAYNVRLTSGDLEPFYYPKRITSANLCESVKSIFRLVSDSGDAWLSWPSDVDVAMTPIVGDTRICYTSSEFEPCTTDWENATSGTSTFPGDFFVLGVTPPITAPVVVVGADGTGSNESRSYVSTFVNGWGQESAPSPTSIITSGKSDATWTVSGFDPIPSNSGVVLNTSLSNSIATLTLDTVFGLRKRESITVSGIAGLSGSLRILSVDAVNKTVTVSAPGGISGTTGTWARVAKHNTVGAKRRLYRTVSTAAGTDFYFVKEFDFNVFSVVDDAGSNVGEPIPTVGWAMPPADLQGIRVHPSGAMIGFSLDERCVCMSEPNINYAWPTAYRITTEYPIVGIGIFGSSIVVGTAGPPYLIQGVEPASMTPTRLDQKWPCLSKRSMADMGQGVAYAAAQGLVVVGQGGAVLATENSFTFNEWRLFSPSSMTAAAFDGRYYTAFDGTSIGDGGMLILDQGAVVRSSWKPTAIYTDHETGRLYVAVNDLLYEWNAEFALRMVGDWMSKEFVLAKPVNLGAAKIDGDFYTTSAEQMAQIALRAQQIADNQALIASLASKGSLNGASLNEISLNGSLVKVPVDVGTQQSAQVVFSIYIKGELWWQKTIADDKAFSLPAGKKYDAYAFRVSGPVPIQAVLVGETKDSLRSV